MADEHRDQIRIVQETVAGKEITFAHVMGGPAPIIYPETRTEPAGGLPFIRDRDHEHDSVRICSHRIRYRSQERQCLSWICRPFYRNHDHYRRDFRRYVRDDRGCRLFP